jgi:hypothetical protein
VRTQIAAEVKQLREKNVGGKPWLLALQTGYKITNDKEGKRRVEDEMLRLFPNWSTTKRMVRQQWDDANPRPRPGDPPDVLEPKMKAYHLALIAATDDWIKRWPDDVGFRSARYFAYAGIEDCNTADLESAAEGFLKAMEKNEGSIFYIPPVQTLIAGTFATRGIATDRIPALVLKELSEMEKRSLRDEPSDLYPGEDSDPGGNLQRFSIACGPWDRFLTLSLPTFFPRCPALAAGSFTLFATPGRAFFFRRPTLAAGSFTFIATIGDRRL